MKVYIVLAHGVGKDSDVAAIVLNTFYSAQAASEYVAEYEKSHRDIWDFRVEMVPTTVV